MEKILEVKNLSVDFHTREGMLRAVDSITFSVEKGKTLGIVGESGSGKSVTSLALMDLLPHNASVRADSLCYMGKEITQRAKLRGKTIAMIFQDPMMSLNPCFTVEFQIAETLKIHTLLRGQALQTRILELLDQVGIPAAKERLRSYPHELSGGMSQRIMIAMAIAAKPKLLIADEPTTALDVTIQAQILRLLKQIQKEEDMGLLLISHDIGVIAENTNHALVMYAGQSVEFGATEDIIQKPLHPYTKALFAALPNSKRKFRERLPMLPGIVPSLAQRPSGCQFHPRCSLAEEKCRAQDISEEYLAPKRTIRCWKKESFLC